MNCILTIHSFEEIPEVVVYRALLYITKTGQIELGSYHIIYQFRTDINTQLHKENYIGWSYLECKLQGDENGS